LALRCYDAALERVPDNELIQYNRSLLVVDYTPAVGAERSLAPAWQSAGDFAESWYERDRCIDSASLLLKYLWMLGDRLGDDALRERAVRVVQACTDDDIARFPRNEFILAVQGLVVFEDYPRAYALLSRRLFGGVDPAGPMHMLLLIYREFASVDQVHGSPDDLARFFESTRPELVRRDLEASEALIDDIVR
jgi:hypothetical protein